MGNKSSLMLQDEEIKQISEETGFSSQQIEKLYSRFTHLDRGNCGRLSKNDLLSIPELAINPLCDRLIEIFFTDSNSLASNGRATTSQQQDGDDARINFRQFVRVLAAFRSASSSSSSAAAAAAQTKSFDEVQPKTAARRAAEGKDFDVEAKLTTGGVGVNDNLSDRLLFVFKIYDADNDGRISFGDLRAILKLMVGNYVGDVQLDKITTRAFVEVDQDNDGFIEFAEFRQVFAGKDMDLFRLSI